MDPDSHQKKEAAETLGDEPKGDEQRDTDARRLNESEQTDEQSGTELSDITERTPTVDDGEDADKNESDELEDDEGRPSEQLIEDSQLFSALDLDERRSLFDTGERVTYEPGEAILKEGEQGDSFYIIEDGEVEVSTVLEGKSVILANLTRGDIFGEVTAFSGKPRTATVAAASLVDVIRFDNEELKALLEKSPEVRDELQTMILGRARDTIEKITKI